MLSFCHGLLGIQGPSANLSVGGAVHLNHAAVDGAQNRVGILLFD